MSQPAVLPSFPLRAVSWSSWCLSKPTPAAALLESLALLWCAGLGAGRWRGGGWDRGDSWNWDGDTLSVVTPAAVSNAPASAFVLCVSRFLFCVLINPLGRTRWSLAREGMVGGVGGPCCPVHVCTHTCPQKQTQISITHTYTDRYGHVETQGHAHMDTDRHENVLCIYTDTVISA